MSTRKDILNRFEEVISIDDPKMQQFVVDTIFQYCVEEKYDVVLHHLEEVSAEELKAILVRHLPRKLTSYYEKKLGECDVHTLAVMCMAVHDTVFMNGCGYSVNTCTIDSCSAELEAEDVIFDTTLEEDRLILTTYMQSLTYVEAKSLLKMAEAVLKTED